jgi:hypothetical protein
MNNNMETPLNKPIKEFERLKGEANTFKDVIYLDDVLTVLDSYKEYEEEYIKFIELKTKNTTLHNYNEDIKDVLKKL